MNKSELEQIGVAIADAQQHHALVLEAVSTMTRIYENRLKQDPSSADTQQSRALYQALLTRELMHRDQLAKAYALIEREIPPTADLPPGRISMGEICCPHGHRGDFSYVEPSTLTRKIAGFDVEAGRLDVESHYTAADETDGTAAYLFCGAWIEEHEDGKPAWCNTAFRLPRGVEIEFV